jgi:hypothetical protein
MRLRNKPQAYGAKFQTAMPNSRTGYRKANSPALKAGEQGMIVFFNFCSIHWQPGGKYLTQ